MDESEDETQNPFSEENWMKQNNWKFIKYENEDEAENPLSEENWVKQTNWKFTKYVIHHRHFMTPEQLKQKPFEKLFKKQHKKLDAEEGESNEQEEESTTSSEKSEQESESDR